ncbi:YopX family protein (plasmid) [Clostridium perfringens]|nr:DNA-packaging protein [Clostridium perfringens]
MNREIKFRVWDKKMKRMLGVQKHSFKTKKSMPYGYNIAYDFGELMQYTGLNDKNEKEIYEDDIIKYSHKAVGTILRKVRMKYGMWGIEGIVKGTQIPFANIPESECEVVGNIHENPELLEGEYSA